MVVFLRRLAMLRLYPIMGKGCDTLIKKVSLFDIFESEKLGPDKKSMAFNIQLVSAESDVTDAMTDAVMEKVLTALNEQLGAQMRA